MSDVDCSPGREPRSVATSFNSTPADKQERHHGTARAGVLFGAVTIIVSVVAECLYTAYISSRETKGSFTPDAATRRDATQRNATQRNHSRLVQRV